MSVWHRKMFGNRPGQATARAWKGTSMGTPMDLKVLYVKEV